MSSGFTYPQHLQDGIGSQYRVLNAGVPGETSDAILSRANAVEICFAKDVTFAKGERQCAMDYKMFKLVGADAPLTYRGFGNQLALSDVIVDGVSYTIEYEKGGSYVQSVFRLTRKDTSKALTIRAGTKVKFNYSPQYDKVQCNVILIGANDGDQSAQSLINKYKKLIALNENYIAIVPFYGPDYSKEFKAAFGDKALNIREYFIKRAHIDYDIDLSAKDKGLVEQGRIPSMYFYKENENDCHLNEKGYKVLGDQVYKKGAELGYWKQQKKRTRLRPFLFMDFSCKSITDMVQFKKVVCAIKQIYGGQYMKKFLSIFMCVILLFALVGCGGQPSNQPDNNKQDASTNSSSDPNSNTSTNSSSDPNSNTSTNSNLSSDTNTNSSSVSSDTKFKLEGAKSVTKFNNPNVVVACWGDSLTEGMAMSKGYTYPQQLQASIGSQYRVINAGVGGEKADAILSRANAIEICFRKDVTFAKGEKQCELPQTLFTAVDGGILTYKGFGNELSFNDVLIGGKSYTLEFKKSEKPEEGTFYLIRKDVSSALTIPAGTKVKFDYSSKYSKIHCNIILIGANDGELSAEALIEKYDINELVFEDIQLQNNVQNNVQTFKTLAEVFGVILELLQERKMTYYVVAPNVWKATFKIAGRGREAEKKLAQKYVLDEYGMKCTQDEADAACIGIHITKTATESFDWA